jgi:Na+/proline symporter
MQNMGAVITGVIIADIFATVASTANGLLVAITQTLQRNVIPVFFKARERKKLLRAEYISIAVGVATILLSISLPGNVYSIIISSLAMLGSGLGGAIMVRVMKWRHTGASLCAALMTGILSALAWKMSGFGDIMNEAAIGLSGSLAANYIVVRWMAKKD